MGRQAAGVRLIRLDEGQKLASIVAFEEEGGEDESSPVSNSSGNVAPAKKADGADEHAVYFDEVDGGYENGENVEALVDEPKDDDTFMQF